MEGSQESETKATGLCAIGLQVTAQLNNVVTITLGPVHLMFTIWFTLYVSASKARSYKIPHSAEWIPK